MTRPIVFVDTETTALGRHARPWEIAVIRREWEPGCVARPAPKRTESEHVLQVGYTLHNLPEKSDPKALAVGRWLDRGAPGSRYLVDMPEGPRGEVDTYAHWDEAAVARRLAGLLEGEPILVGVGVHFDAAVLSSMFLRHGLPEEPWHYAIVDLKAATWGLCREAMAGGMVTDAIRRAASLPMSSERLAEAMQVDPPDGEERHTALGDARWARRWFDAVNADADS